MQTIREFISLFYRVADKFAFRLYSKCGFEKHTACYEATRFPHTWNLIRSIVISLAHAVKRLVDPGGSLENREPIKAFSGFCRETAAKWRAAKRDEIETSSASQKHKNRPRESATAPFLAAATPEKQDVTLAVLRCPNRESLFSLSYSNFRGTRAPTTSL